MSGEWNACDTCIGRTVRPAASISAAAAATASRRPEITTLFGPLIAARPTSPACSPRSANTFSGSAKTAAMSPSCGRLPISRARSASSPRPSSRLKTPPTTAATYSPTLWPNR